PPELDQALSAGTTPMRAARPRRLRSPARRARRSMPCTASLASSRARRQCWSPGRPAPAGPPPGVQRTPQQPPRRPALTVCAIFTAAVNKPQIVNMEGAFEAEALRILRATPGLTVTAEATEVDRRGDATLRFAGNRVPIAVEVKRRVSAAAAWQV